MSLIIPVVLKVRTYKLIPRMSKEELEEGEIEEGEIPNGDAEMQVGLSLRLSSFACPSWGGSSKGRRSNQMLRILILQLVLLRFLSLLFKLSNWLRLV